MTILQIASGTSIYGGETILLTLSQYLRKKGHKVIILSPGRGELVEMCHRLGYEAAVIPLKKTYDITGVMRLVLLLKRKRVDVVHSHGLLVNIISRTASFLAGCKIINTIHVIQHLRDGSVTLSRRLKNSYYRILDNLTARFCRKIIAVSKAVESDLVTQGLKRDKLLTIPNGIEEVNSSVKRDRRLLHQFGIRDSDRVVGLVGRIVPLKGHDDFIACAKLLTSSYPEIKFLIAGRDLRGGYLSYLKAKVKREGLEGKVIFTGFLDSMRDVMSGFDVLTLPAWEEPFGLVILEAMSVGVPVVATNAGGIPEVIRDGYNGLLIPPHSPEALSQAILRILNNGDFATRLSQEGLKTVKNYTAEKMSKAVEDIYINISHG